MEERAIYVDIDPNDIHDAEPELLFDSHYRAKQIMLDYGTEPLIKAGSPISASGKVSNNASAIGILKRDCYRHLTSVGDVIIGGYIKSDIAQSHSGIKISDAARAAMSRLAFIGADGVPDGHPQSDWNQNDNTQPDYVKNRPGGYTAVIQKGVDIHWDGVIGDKECIDQGGVLLVKVSDDILTSEQLSGAEITQIGTNGVETVTYNHTIDGNKLTHNAGFLVEQGLSNFIVIEDQTAGYNTGTYVMHMVDKDTTLYTSSIYKQDETGILPIPEEYIDDAIQRVGADVIIQSSTPNSTKKFKITVDDSGTISAAEVS